MENKTIGIYAIFRKSDDKCVYVGQSKECESRIRQHLNGTTNTPIENKDDYYTDIIERHGFDSKEFRLSREAFWINIFEPEWNKMRNRTHCEETRQKNREAHLGDKNPTKREEVRQKISKSLLGKPSGMKDKTHSEESIQKIREANLGKHHNMSKKHWKVVDGKRIWY